MEKRGRRNVVVRTIGCAWGEDELKRHEMQARKELDGLSPQVRLDFGGTARERLALELLRTARVKAVGPELILGAIFDRLGFGQIDDELFKGIVLARLVYPASQLKTAEYLWRRRNKEIEVARICRFLDRLRSRYQEQVERIAYNYSKRTLGELIIVFYDMQTLSFEAEDEDDLRQLRFSKDGKFQHPQVTHDVLVGCDGYPISHDIFEGNTFEGETLLPLLQRAEKRFGLAKPAVVADSALLSNKNVRLLMNEG